MGAQVHAQLVERASASSQSFGSSRSVPAPYIGDVKATLVLEALRFSDEFCLVDAVDVVFQSFIFGKGRRIVLYKLPAGR